MPRCQGTETRSPTLSLLSRPRDDSAGPEHICSPVGTRPFRHRFCFSTGQLEAWWALYDANSCSPPRMASGTRWKFPACGVNFSSSLAGYSESDSAVAARATTAISLFMFGQGVYSLLARASLLEMLAIHRPPPSNPCPRARPTPHATRTHIAQRGRVSRWMAVFLAVFVPEHLRELVCRNQFPQVPPFIIKYGGGLPGQGGSQCLQGFEGPGPT